MRQYVVDAFTNSVFHGNQAAVCVMEKWPSEELMMNITRENNFSETAFTVKEGNKWHLRWFTPGGEIDLCGHATLGTSFVLLNFYEKEADKVVFTTLSGELIVTRKGMIDPVVRLHSQFCRFTGSHQAVQFHFKGQESAPVKTDFLPVQQNPGIMCRRVKTQADPHSLPGRRQGNLPAVFRDPRPVPEPGIRALVIIGSRHRNRLPVFISLKTEIPYAAQVNHHSGRVVLRIQCAHLFLRPSGFSSTAPDLCRRASSVPPPGNNHHR